MAERRMFSKSIVDSDAFIDMPVSARLLYYDLGMRADDDGFVNSPKKITRMTGASDDDIRILCAKNFIIPFDSGVVVITNWKTNNHIRKDTYHETICKAEKSMLSFDDTGTYSLRTRNALVTDSLRTCDELVSIPSTQDSIGKNSIEKNNNTVQKSDDFELFWKSYPRKQGKQAALKAFKKIKNVPVQKMIEAIEQQRHSEQWMKNNGQFVPMPSTWLNQGRWDDEPDVFVDVENDGSVIPIVISEEDAERHRHREELIQSRMRGRFSK